MKSNRLIIIAFIFLFTACSRLSDSTNSPIGQQNISGNDPIQIEFEADVSTTTYRAITFSNTSSNLKVINNLAFVDNGCNAFSIYNIVDSSENILYTEGETLSIGVNTSQSVNLNLRFSPTPCDVTSYTSTLMIYYTESEVNKYEAVNLVATVADNSPPPVICENQDIEYYDEYDNPTQRTLPELEDGKSYYVRIDKMSAYIQTTGAFIGYSATVGTTIDLEYIDPEDRFKPTYIPLTADANGNITIDTIDACTGFYLPSAITHPFLVGATMSVTTAQDFTGTINSTAYPGRLEIPNIQWTLYAYINNSASLMQSNDGYFNVLADFDLTTGSTEYNEYLEALENVTDNDGNLLLNVQDGKMVGQDIRHGTIKLVGIGTFLETDDAKLSDAAFTGIFETEAYLFLQIEGIVTQAVE